MKTVSSRVSPMSLLRRLLCGLALVLVIGLMPAFAADNVSCDYDIDLPVQEMEQPGLDELLFGGFPEERYFLIFEGQYLVSATDEVSLTQMVIDAAEQYVNDETISVSLADPQQVQLCYGAVSIWADTDVAAAQDILNERLITVTVEEKISEEPIPYQELVEEDPDSYVDETPSVTVGVNGLGRFTTHTICRNGEALSSQVVDTEVLRPAVDQVTVVGSKEHSPYNWPIEGGRISSHFGPRNIRIGSRNHKGIDIAVSRGTEVHASRAGTVICAKYSGNYGNLVQIEHEDGSVTYYAHNSALCVKVGDVVEQGDVIAKVGSTGRSTGPHCHFEIRINGEPVDPEQYLEPRN